MHTSILHPRCVWTSPQAPGIQSPRQEVSHIPSAAGGEQGSSQYTRASWEGAENLEVIKVEPRWTELPWPEMQMQHLRQEALGRRTRCPSTAQPLWRGTRFWSRFARARVALEAVCNMIGTPLEGQNLPRGVIRSLGALTHPSLGQLCGPRKESFLQVTPNCQVPNWTLHTID